MSGQSDSSLLDAMDLQQQLEEKNQLVAALTERLEEAAERLDRVSRSGGDKGGRSTGGGGGGGGGVPAEFVTQQQTIIEQLNKSVDMWEDVQPRDAFERIESQLEDLRSMLKGTVVGTPTEGPPAKKKDPLAGWEKMKAELMGGASSSAPPSSTESSQPSNGTSSSVPPANPSPPPTGDPVATSDAPPAPSLSLSESDLPKPVDFDTADRDQLEDAIKIRDQYIGNLSRRLRSAESRSHEAINWAELNNAPDELRESLQHLESELNDRLRIAEVDLSLERARLSRIETRIHTMQQQIERRLESAGQLGAGQGGSGGTAGSTTQRAKKESPSKSWFGSLGRS